MGTDISIARTILDQLGGSRFVAMTGAKNMVTDGNSLTMKIMRNKVKAQYLTITLNSLDLYNMQFKSIDKDYNLIIRAERENVYFDDLQRIFTNITGLNTTL